MEPNEKRLELLIDLRRYKEAEEYARECLAGNPDWGEGYTQLARVLKALGRISEAVEAAKTSVAKDPQNAFAFATLAQILLETQHLELAQDCIAETLRLSPGYAWGYYLLSSVYEKQNHYEKMHQAAVQGLNYSPHDEWLIYQKGWAEKNLKQYDTAIKTAEEGLRLHPNAEQLWSLRGSLLNEIEMRSNNPDFRHYRMAEKSLREAIRLNPADRTNIENRDANLLHWRSHFIRPPLIFILIAWFIVYVNHAMPFAGANPAPRPPILFTAWNASRLLMCIWITTIILPRTRKYAFFVVPLSRVGIPSHDLTRLERQLGICHWVAGIILMGFNVILGMMLNKQ